MKIYKTLWLYIFKEILLYFSITLFAFIAVLLTVNILKLSGLIINKGVPLASVCTVFITLIPTFLEIALPLAALLGVMTAFARFSGDSEIVVMRASGISIFNLTPPVVLFGALMFLITSIVSHHARPWGFSTLDTTLFEIAREKATAGLTEGIFSPLGDITLYSNSVDYECGELSQVLIDDRRNPQERQITLAKSGALSSDAATKQIMVLLKDGTTHTQRKDTYNTTRFQSNILSFDTDELLDGGGDKPGKQLTAMSQSDLAQTEDEYRGVLDRITTQTITESDLPYTLRTGPKIFKGQLNEKEMRKRINRAITEFGRRDSMPFAAAILSMIGFILGIQPPRTQRTWGIALSVLFGMATFITYYGVLSIGLAMSEASVLHPLTALWIPNALSTIIGLILLRQLGRERWNSVADAAIDWSIRVTRWRRSI